MLTTIVLWLSSVSLVFYNFCTGFLSLPFPLLSPKSALESTTIPTPEIPAAVLPSWCPTDHENNYRRGAQQFLTHDLCSGLEITFIVLLSCLGVLPMYLYLAFDS